jgi:hypothetical protein
MKNIFFTFSLILSFLFSYSQTKKITIAKKQIGFVECQYDKSIHIETSDTSNYLSFWFQNKKYKSIVDIKSLIFTTTKDSSSVFEFVKSLKEAYNEIGNKSDIMWNKPLYRMSLFSWTDNLYLYEPSEEGSGFTTLNKEETNQLINWIEEIGFKK